MRKLIEASLVLSLATALTLIIMAVIFPRHALGGGQQASELHRIWPAVFVYGTHDRPGTGGGHALPRLAGQDESSGCPYLAAPAAASSGPATPRRDAEFACPYLLKVHRQLTGPVRVPAAPRELQI